jgi:hypothetical protein
VTATPPSTLHASGARRLVSVQEAPPFTAGRHHVAPRRDHLPPRIRAAWTCRAPVISVTPISRPVVKSANYFFGSTSCQSLSFVPPALMFEPRPFLQLMAASALRIAPDTHQDQAAARPRKRSNWRLTPPKKDQRAIDYRRLMGVTEICKFDCDPLASSDRTTSSAPRDSGRPAP